MAPRTDGRKKERKKEKKRSYRKVGELWRRHKGTDGREEKNCNTAWCPSRPPSVARPDSIRSMDDGESAEKLAGHGSIRELTWGAIVAAGICPLPRALGAKRGRRLRLKQLMAKQTHFLYYQHEYRNKTLASRPRKAQWQEAKRETEEVYVVHLKCAFCS